MAISTIYEVDKSQTDRFYAVERAGYVDVGSLVRDVVGDMINYQWFTVVHMKLVTIAKLNGTTDFTMNLPSDQWPPRERLIEFVNTGGGYAPGNKLEIPLTVAANVVLPDYEKVTQNIKITVSNVDATTGEITDFTVDWPGSYFASQANGTAVSYATNLKTPLAPTAGLTSGYQTYAEIREIWGNTSNTVGSALASQTPAQSIGENASQEWSGNYGGTGVSQATGFGMPKPPEGGSTGRKTQTTGIWFTIATAKAANNALEINANVYIGQTIGFAKGKQRAKTSVIPAGTKVVNVGLFDYISGTKSTPTPNNGTPIFSEATTQGVWLVVDQPVTINWKDVIAFYGTSATVKNTTVQFPKAWQVITEASGAVDPINDAYGVDTEVVATTTNSPYVRVTNLNTVPSYPAQIYEGQSVVSLDSPGSIGDDLVYVESVTMESATIANVKLNMPKSIPASEGLKFIFDQLQPWRLAFDIKENTTYKASGPQTLNVYAATPVQLQDNGNISAIWLGNTTGTGTATTTTYSKTDIAGIMGDLPSGAQATINPAIPTEGFLNRSARTGTDPEAYPLNYALTMTERGVFFGLWEGTWSTLQKKKVVGSGGDNFFNWFLIQRPVNRYTGKTLTKGRCPVFCLNSVGYKYWKFIVREEDVLHPSIGDKDNIRESWDFANSKVITSSASYRVPADANTQDSFALINTTNQVALTEDSKYLVSFIHNLSTPRFRYSEELDMIGQTSADVCMAGNDISIKAYNETGNRVYRALPANNPYNTGLRVAVLKDVP
jgi:hypothetical protein